MTNETTASERERFEAWALPIPAELLRVADAIDPLKRTSLDNLTCSVAAQLLRQLAASPLPAPQEPADWEAAYRQFADGPAFGPEVPALKKAFAAGMAWQASATTNGPAAWQPIETAPKDLAILLGNKHGSWIGKWLPVYVSGYVPDNPWSSLMLNHDHMGEKWHPPTHWQPLYAAPAPDSTRGTP